MGPPGRNARHAPGEGLWPAILLPAGACALAGVVIPWLGGLSSLLAAFLGAGAFHVIPFWCFGAALAAGMRAADAVQRPVLLNLSGPAFAMGGLVPAGGGPVTEPGVPALLVGGVLGGALLAAGASSTHRRALLLAPAAAGGFMAAMLLVGASCASGGG